MTGIALPQGLGSQSTMTEQARELATVHAMMSMAQQFPRNEQLARSRMQDACGRYALAEKAFFRFPRSGEMVNGPSVHLARELARCWGNVEHGIKELARDDLMGRSEMLARAWDIEMNTVSFNTFIVPHKRDRSNPKTKEKWIEDLNVLRDIYENNANAGARRLREAIYAVLPIWFRQEAIELCMETLERGADQGSEEIKPMVQRKDDMISGFATEYKIVLRQLEQKIGTPEGRWTARDLATMGVIYKSLKAGETTVDLEFHRDQPYADEIGPAAPVQQPVPVEQPVQQPVQVPEQPQTPIVPAALLSQIVTQLHALDVRDRVDAMTTVQLLVGREQPPGLLDDLTHAEAVAVNNRLADILKDEHPGHALDAVLDAIRNGDEVIATDPDAQAQT